MNDHDTFRPTPPSIALLVAITAVTALVSAILAKTAPYFFSINGPQNLLALSLWGLNEGYFWQIFTYAFVLPNDVGGITYDWLLRLGFNCAALLAITPSLLENIGKKAFFQCYFGAIIAGGLFAAGALWGAGFGAFCGIFPAVYASMLLYGFVFPEKHVYILSFPLKASHLALIVIGANLLVDLSQVKLWDTAATFGSLLFTYAYGLFVLRIPSPYAWTQDADAFVLDRLTAPRSKKNKIVELHPQKTDDDSFMDTMLEKIGKGGEESLTAHELSRMRSISRMKSRQKQ